MVQAFNARVDPLHGPPPAPAMEVDLGDHDMAALVHVSYRVSRGSRPGQSGPLAASFLCHEPSVRKATLVTSSEFHPKVVTLVGTGSPTIRGEHLSP